DTDSTSDTDTGETGDTGDPDVDPELILGAPGRILLRGMVVTPAETFAGEVLVVEDLITCVAVDCAGEPEADVASIVDTHGVIMPGMIDTHNHVQFAIFDEDDWTPAMVYSNHNQWPNEPAYQEMLDAKQYLNGEGGSPINLNCEMNKYGELKALVAGTTAVTGAANPSNKKCYRTLARTIDQSANGLCGTVPPQSCPDGIQNHTIFPGTAAADGVCANFEDGSTDAYLVNVGEGVDDVALSELDDLYTAPTIDGCLFDPRTAVVQGTAFGEMEFDLMAANGMGLVWSPRSNVFLYGGQDDLTKTTNIPLALAKGINVSLAPDWSLGGSQNLLDELRFANEVDDGVWGDLLTPQDLVEMVTINAARNLGLDDRLGTLEVGKKADITVISGDTDAPYDAILAATPVEVGLVLVDGRALYGAVGLVELGAPMPGCEELDMVGKAKFSCVAVEGGAVDDKFGQTYATIVDVLGIALQNYDREFMTDFWPLAPLYDGDE
ncbi:MAG: amidohydrolase family protein, partial [Myxococcales bacterium]|nr:amidohydrolase family protein [Myxococcales bacterium]